jgi:NADH:ubiquinone oxidoreductase subunit 5 (subunit L)/multisubunit Na+/H+ antiporter MnhA subunit
MPPFNLGLWGVTLLCAELFMVLVRTNEIHIVFRSKKQRTDEEQKQIARGLRKSLSLEILLFVPASVLLGLIILLPLLWGRFGLTTDGSHQIWFYGLLGIASYNFPYAAIRLLSQNRIEHVERVCSDNDNTASCGERSC